LTSKKKICKEDILKEPEKSVFRLERKLPRIGDRRLRKVCINCNTHLFAIVDYKGFGKAQKPIFQVLWVYSKVPLATMPSTQGGVKASYLIMRPASSSSKKTPPSQFFKFLRYKTPEYFSAEQEKIA